MIDLNVCERGDKLLSTHGILLTYLCRRTDTNYCPHMVEYPTGSTGSRTDDGYVYEYACNRLPEDHDIVAIFKKFQ